MNPQLKTSLKSLGWLLLLMTTASRVDLALSAQPKASNYLAVAFPRWAAQPWFSFALGQNQNEHQH